MEITSESMKEPIKGADIVAYAAPYDRGSGVLPYAETYKSVLALSPKAKISRAAEIATALTEVIESRKLYSLINGKKYVKYEGWVLCGSFFNLAAHEVSTTRLEDGSYEAVFEIRDDLTGQVVSRSGAICGRDEKRWANADSYAVRSMAGTRAAGKAFRIRLSWVITLAGYEPTTAEEMEGVEARGAATSSPAKAQARPAAEKPSGYDPYNPVMQDAMAKELERRMIPSSYWNDIGLAMKGKPSKDLDAVIREVYPAQL